MAEEKRTSEMSGKVVVITGATSGIGQAAARRLALMGARVVLVARDRNRAEATRRRLATLNPDAAHTVHHGDLSVLSETRGVANRIADAEPRIDVLINNAGAIFTKRAVTEDGLEQTFALNHMSYFVMTRVLLPRLAPDARIVNTASEAHRTAKFDLNALTSDTRYRAFRTYGLTKLCNILFTRELARRLNLTRITANCLHPGIVASRFFDNVHGGLGVLLKLGAFFMISPEQGAQTIVYLASSDQVRGITGQYFSRCRFKMPTREAQSDDAARQLWNESQRLAGRCGSGL
jgi:NAD(P)-dependent dehydrogenase (short-subunit alcohol dehydrogenase family)